jgi:hypothetical protein
VVFSYNHKSGLRTPPAKKHPTRLPGAAGGRVGLIALQLLPRPCIAPFLTALIAVGLLLLVLDNCDVHEEAAV